MNLEHNSMTADLKTFSAFWPVAGNPKPGNRRHLKMARKKNLDYFIHDERIMPSLPFITNLKDSLSQVGSRATALKFGHPIKPEVFFELCSIWTSKILFFKEIESDGGIVWRDCVHNTKYNEIINTNSDKIVIRKYPRNQMPARATRMSRRNSFGGIRTYPYKDLLSAQVIKMPAFFVDEVVETYKDCLQEVDRHYEIYDEEIVLSYMRDHYPNYFKVI